MDNIDPFTGHEHNNPHCICEDCTLADAGIEVCPYCGVLFNAYDELTHIETHNADDNKQSLTTIGNRSINIP